MKSPPKFDIELLGALLYFVKGRCVFVPFVGIRTDSACRPHWNGAGLFPIVNPFHTRRYGGENFVGDRIDDPGYFGHRQLFPEYFYPVAFLAGNIGDIYQRDIHADVSDNRCFLPVYDHIPVAPAQMPV